MPFPPTPQLDKLDVYSSVRLGASMFARLIFCLLLSLAFSPANAAGPHGSIRVGLWSGGAYSNDSTGAFSHCAAGATYNSGIMMLVGLGSAKNWTLGFMHPSWQLKPGESNPIVLTFDGREQFNVYGVAQTPTFVLVPMPQNSSLLSEFRKSNGMVALAKGNTFQFALTSTSQLMAVLTNCVDRMNRGGMAAAGDFGALSSKAQAAPAQPVLPQPAAPVAVPSSLRSETTEDHRLEAMEVATNFILKTSLQNPRIVNRSDIPATLVADRADWRSEEASGSVKIISGDGNLKGIDIASAIATADSNECKGKFMTGRAADLVDSDVVFRGFSICDDTSGSRSAQYFVVPRTKGGFIVLSVVSDMKTEQARNAMKDEKVSALSKAALLAVSMN